MPRRPVSLLALLLAACAACSDPRPAALRLSKEGRPEEAAERLYTAATESPDAAWAAEALSDAGRLWSAAGDCERSRAAFEELARRNESPAWDKAAREGVMSCPDYLPRAPGWAWTYGDSQTGGKNMRQQLSVVETPSGGEGAVVEAKTWAGPRLFSTLRRAWRVSAWTLEETEPGGAAPTVLLRYPFRAGQAWTSKRGGREVTFELVDDAAEVRTRGGDFTGCLKVREHIRGLPSWTYVYYAPGVGRVLTSAGGPGFETRSSELLAFQRPQEP